MLQVLPVPGPSFLQGEPVTSNSCDGIYVLEDGAGLINNRLTLDDPTAVCNISDVLTGTTSGAQAVIGAELVGAGTVERAWVAADTYPAVVLDGSTTDNNHFMWLTAPGTERHGGIAGDGVVIAPTSPGHGIAILDDYTRLEWIEVTDWSSNSGGSFDGINIMADQVLLNAVIVHDDGHGSEVNSDANGINLELSNMSATVRNALVYDVARSGITIHQASGAILTIENSTVYRCAVQDNSPANFGCIGTRAAAGSSINVTHSIAISTAGSDFFHTGASVGTWVGAGYNISGDTTAPGMAAQVSILPDAALKSIAQRLRGPAPGARGPQPVAPVSNHSPACISM